MTSYFYVNRFQALFPVIFPTVFIVTLCGPALDWTHDIAIGDRIGLIFLLALNGGLLFFCFSVVAKPKIILEDSKISLRSFLGKYEVIERSICEIKIGQDYIDFKDTQTSKVHHLGQNPFSQAEWSKLVDALD